MSIKISLLVYFNIIKIIRCFLILHNNLLAVKSGTNIKLSILNKFYRDLMKWIRRKINT